MFYGVQFSCDGKYAVVPESWLLNYDFCRWPQSKVPEEIERLVKKSEKPHNDWGMWPCRVFHETCSSKYLLNRSIFGS